jgi:hypothetical protein
MITIPRSEASINNVIFILYIIHDDSFMGPVIINHFKRPAES